ncbi:MAG: DUF1538 domain-containing protein [Lachnospiraceae bacterium]|nr:DUF1538 domain-containing protein [Lachnospiraceae bacterium]
MFDHKDVTVEKIKESCRSVLPISGIVLVLTLFFVPLSSGLLLSFLLGSVLIIVGMALFNIGADVSMSQIGANIGAKMTQSRNIFLILGLSLLLGIAITVAEPDLQVLASNASNIDKMALIITVSVGVGFFLMLSMLRIFFGIPLKYLLFVFYGAVFVLAFLTRPDMLSIAFDAGGVTTGPMTVPFIMALGVGVAAIRSDKRAKADSFGLVSLCSIGPILAVFVLSFFYKDSSSEPLSLLEVQNFDVTVSLGFGYLKAFPEYMAEVALALLPIFCFFMLFQIVSLRLKKKAMAKILVGILYTYAGLVLFLTGVNVGFSSLGFCLGEAIGKSAVSWTSVPFAMIMGWFIINAEPAVQILNKQVNEISAGAISEKVMGRTLSIAIAVAMGLALVRVLTGLPILYFVLPGYFIALILAIFVSPTFTAIAFDAGGVASGPLTATFALPFAMGVCISTGGNVMTDAFGLVALVAMMPLITVQIMGAIAMVKTKREAKITVLPEAGGNDEIIELWEVE